MARNFTITGPEGDEITLPTRWEICDECQGEGKHSHAIDGNGITSSEFAEWEPEDREFYFAGGYDQHCTTCDGTGKIKVVDEDRLSPELLSYWQDYQVDIAASEACERMERRFGA